MRIYSIHSGENTMITNRQFKGVLEESWIILTDEKCGLFLLVIFEIVQLLLLLLILPVNMPMVIQPLVRRWANVLMSACPNIGPTLANSKNSISVIIQLPKIWLACQPLTNIGPMLEWCWHYVPNIGPMLGQVDIGMLARRRTNGWQMDSHEDSNPESDTSFWFISILFPFNFSTLLDGIDWLVANHRNKKATNRAAKSVAK